MKRAQWLAVVGSATLGLAGLAGCQSFGGYPSGSWGSGDAGIVRAAEPDDPQSVPSLQLNPMEKSAGHSGEDPFAPISVEQLLPATTQRPQVSMPYSSENAPAGYVAPPAPIHSIPGALVPPTPMAVMRPMPVSPSPLMAGAHAWEASAAMHGSCPQCGHNAGASSGMFTSMIENMVIFAGGDYFSNSGMINKNRLNNSAAALNVVPVDVPDLDPQRVGSMLSVNAAAPFTPGGDLCFQIGGTYIETEEGAQGFFTTGIYHRCEPGEKWGLNWGMVYDIAYDDFIDYAIGQIRLKAGFPLTSHDEVGGWLSIGTNTEQVDVTVTTLIIGTVDPIFADTIRARVRPECQGHFFWRHVYTCGAESTLYMGGRENLGGSFVLGYTSQLPVTDCWSILSGGHWSHDSEDRGSFDVYMGIGYYPGGNARSTGTCGNRFMPYQDVANNTFMPMSINPRFIEVAPDRAPL